MSGLSCKLVERAIVSSLAGCGGRRKMLRGRRMLLILEVARSVKVHYTR